MTGLTGLTGLTRRRLLLLGGAGLAGAGVAVLAGCSTASTSSVSEPEEFDTPLPIPPLAESRWEAGTRTFSLRAQEGSWQFQPGAHGASTWGFNGPYGGPTLRANVGERVAVEVGNDLPEATSTHWHGMHLPAEMDGGPHQMVEPGDTWRAEWVIGQAPCTLWYHPHPHGQTERHVYRGLAGMFWLDDPQDPVTQALPHTYAVDDVPVIIGDKTFDDQGELVIDDGGNEVGLLGDVVTVNGVAGARLEVTTTLVRLRILNASTARIYSLGIADRSMLMIASDGGLLRSPLELERVRLSPGERAEVLVALDPGDDVRLHSFEPELGSVAAPFAVGANDSFDVLRLVAADELAASAEVPEQLASFGLDAAAVGPRRRFELEDREINGARMDMARIDETVELGDTEMWTVVNRNLFPHNFHVHDVQFEVRSIDGEPPPPELAGRKDTVYLEPQREYELLMQFIDYTDPQMPYMYHCHLLRHEDEGMMGQFVVVQPGERADPSMISGHGGH
ncbi:multicopper oxidase family protein [Ruania zhangjianzhongii]|uniref:multicopper oxidase family protein n=1 Tax=Ruania zhangjianzhongii TaxID=2603206 RepID=UPI0011C840B1|nr:multicopper oxidase domain-containing protein [Ruania zhangjianzhongii]